MIAVLTGLVLAAGTTVPAFGKKEPQENCAKWGEIELCGRFQNKIKLARGGKTRFILRVEGTPDPVDIRLFNFTPGVLKVRGGADRVVTTSGGKPNQVKVKVKSRRPGDGGLRWWPHYSDPRRAAAAVAVTISPQLAAAEERFLAARERLPVVAEAQRSYRRKSVLLLIDETEEDLLQILILPELRPLYDMVTDRFENARHELGNAPRRAALGHPPEPGQGVVFAVLPAERRASFALAAGGKSVTGEVVDSILDRLAALLGRLKEAAQKNDLVVDLCVTSSPAGATFEMGPYRETHETVTDPVLTDGVLTVYRGLYRYVLKKKPHQPIRSQLNLWDDPKPILHCVVGESCVPRPGSIEQCPDD